MVTTFPKFLLQYSRPKTKNKHKHSLNLDKYKHSGPLICKKETVVSIIEDSKGGSESNENAKSTSDRRMITFDELDGSLYSDESGSDATENIKKSDGFRKTEIGFSGLDCFSLPNVAGNYLITVDKHPESGDMEVVNLVEVNLMDTEPTTSSVETNQPYMEEVAAHVEGNDPLETIPETYFVETDEEIIEKKTVNNETDEDYIGKEAVNDETVEYLETEMIDEEQSVSNFTQKTISRGGRPAHGTQVCDFPNCGKFFKAKCRLEEHKLSHGPKNFVCDECNKRYHTQKLLNEHLRDSKKHKINLSNT